MTATSVMAIVGTGVFELCVFNHKHPEWVGYYDDPAQADQYIAAHQQRDIFLTPQVLNPSLIQRSRNKMVRADDRTKNLDVIGYKYY